MTHQALVHKRIRTLLVATFALFGIIIGQLFSVQVVRAGTISERAANELLKTSTLLAPRGVISDVNGVELARSVAAMTIVVDQAQITNPELTAKITSPVLQMSEAELISLFTGKLRYKIIVKSAKPAMWTKLQNTISESQLALQASKDLAEELNTKVSAKNGVIEDLLSKLEGA
jgi:cell division protein FtsI (penicillin-binding protein 3)